MDTSFTPHLPVPAGRWSTSLNRLVFRTTVEGADRVPADGPVIIAPVHRSFIDFFVASEVTGRKLHYMAKDSLWKNRCWPGILPAVGAFPVHRESADREALRRAQQVLEAGEVLILFPEGERRAGPVVEDLHEGVAFLAARTGATVVPVGHRRLGVGDAQGQAVPRPRHIHLVVGDPIPPPERTGGGRISRSRIHAAHRGADRSLQDLYDRSVDGHRPLLTSPRARSSPWSGRSGRPTSDRGRGTVLSCD